MVVIAVLLLVLVLTVVVLVSTGGSSQTVRLEWSQLSLVWEPSVIEVFLVGALTLLVAVVALVLLRRGLGGRVARRRELRRLRSLESEVQAAQPPVSTGDPGPATDRPAAPGPDAPGRVPPGDLSPDPDAGPGTAGGSRRPD